MSGLRTAFVSSSIVKLDAKEAAVAKAKQIAVEDIMSTALIVVKESDSIDRAQMEMDLANIRHLPVVDDKHHAVGILSNRDLLQALSHSHGKPVAVAKIMTRRIKTVRPSTPAYQAAELLMENKIGSLPVVDEDEHVVGIVTETDFLAIAHAALTGKKLDRMRDE